MTDRLLSWSHHRSQGHRLIGDAGELPYIECDMAARPQSVPEALTTVQRVSGWR